jgi:hypothetical protein
MLPFLNLKNLNLLFFILFFSSLNLRSSGCNTVVKTWSPILCITDDSLPFITNSASL